MYCARSPDALPLDACVRVHVYACVPSCACMHVLVHSCAVVYACVASQLGCFN